MRFLQSVDAIRTRLRVVENGLEQKEAALTGKISSSRFSTAANVLAAESKNTPLAEENSQLKADLKAATKAKNQLEEMKSKYHSTCLNNRTARLRINVPLSVS